MTPLVLPGWQIATPRLPGTEATIPFPDPVVADAETQAMDAHQHRSSAWLLLAWPWIVGSLTLWNRDRQTQWEQMLSTFPTAVGAWEDTVGTVWARGATEARRGPHATRQYLPALSLPQRRRAEWLARQSAGAKMREWADGLRDDVRWQVVDAVRRGTTAADLATTLADRWRIHGVDFLRIAATELASAYHDGLLASLPAGSRVYVPPVGDVKVCAACQRLLEGRTFRVSPHPLAHPTAQEGRTMLWPGKSNAGRAPADWWPCLPAHCWCRHRAVVIPEGSAPRTRVRRG